ncbi:hypothetical protein LA6_003693 [Marinibacterium anthonyi]|nr:hypothetical protein LA6_003693 [Marinibacterium anthonyi]
MITPKTLIANAVLMLAASFPQLVSAEGFTSADVLAWSENEQNNYFQINIRMIAIVAAQMERNGSIAECIDQWHGGGEASLPARVAQIRKGMEALPDYHPQAVILAVIQKECGNFQ